MTGTYVDEDSDFEASAAITFTIPTCHGGDVVIIGYECITTSCSITAGWDQILTFKSPATGVTQAMWSKVMGGAAGSDSTDIGSTVTLTPGSPVKSSATMTIWRGVDPASPIDIADWIGISPTSGQTTFTGKTVTTDQDGCVIVSVYMDKTSTSPWTITPPATPIAYTLRSDGRNTTTSSGRANVVQASQPGGSAGNWGGNTWNVSGTPGSVGIWTVALRPINTTTDLHPIADISHTTNVVGVPDASNLYANIDEATVNWTDYVELPQGDSFKIKVSSGTDPGTDTGFLAFYDVGFAAGAATCTGTFKLIQGASTVIATWTDTWTADQVQLTHDLDPADIADVTDFTDLRIEFDATTVA